MDDGIVRQARFVNNEYLDIKEFSLLNEEFYTWNDVKY